MVLETIDNPQIKVGDLSVEIDSSKFNLEKELLPGEMDSFVKKTIDLAKAREWNEFGRFVFSLPVLSKTAIEDVQAGLTEFDEDQFLEDGETGNHEFSPQGLVVLKNVFPLEYTKQGKELWNKVKTHADRMALYDIQRADQRAITMTQFFLAEPSMKNQLNLTGIAEDIAKNFERRRDRYSSTDELDGNSCFYFAHAAARFRILFPERFEELRVEELWEQFVRGIPKVRAEGLNQKQGSLLPLYLWDLQVLAAREVVVDNEGLKIVTKKSLKNESQQEPEERSF